MMYKGQESWSCEQYWSLIVQVHQTAEVIRSEIAAAAWTSRGRVHFTSVHRSIRKSVE